MSEINDERRPIDPREVCPECGSWLTHVSGCDLCVMCGHSRCGG